VGQHRYIRPGHDASVWISSGRWGPKRVMVSQCWAVLRAEDVYTGLLRDNAARAKAGEHGWLGWRLPNRKPLRIEWEFRPNAVWRFGRLFLTCPRCGQRATRIYVPRKDTDGACRRCWGLTYESRQRRTYRAGSLSRYGGLFSALSYAACRAAAAREERAEASAKRQAERQAVLRRFGR